MIIRFQIVYLLIIGTLAFANCKHKSIVKTSLIERLERGQHLKIAALGTSLTGGTWRWFDVMAEWLDEAYPDQVSHLNLGVGASASSYPPGSSGLDKVKELDGFNPDVVFIEFAVNDAYKPYNISVDESRKNLESMIATLKNANPEVEIILQTMNLVIDMPELNMAEAAKRSDLSKYLEMYRQVANKKHLLLIDHYPNWENYLNNEGRDAYIKIVTDGIHPSLEGYRMILLPELQKTLNQ